MHNRHIGEEHGSVFQQKLQRRAASGNHQVGRTLPILILQKVALTLLLRLTRKSGHVAEPRTL